MSQVAEVSPENWELLIIDNNSTDNTRLVADDYLSSLPIRYCFEPSQGLAHARNRAIAEFQGDLLVFTDDDILVNETWLQAYHAALSIYPDACYFGGPIKPCFPGGWPRWLRDETMPLISGLIGHYDLGAQSRRYTADDMHPFGANFGLRRAMIERLGLFDTELGVKGNVPGRAEEAEYFHRAGRNGFYGRYLADASCRHCVQPAHLKLAHLYRYGIQKGIAESYLARTAPDPVGWGREIWQWIRGAAQLLKGRSDRWRQSVISAGILRGRRLSASGPGHAEAKWRAQQ